MKFVRQIKRRRKEAYSTLNTIELSKSALLHNVGLFRDKVVADCWPVLKSNAYGHGITEIAEMLNDCNLTYVCVDGYFEADRIRTITKHQILVLGYIKPENVKLLDVKKCTFVVQDLEGLKAFGSLNKHVRIHLELNTGMNRMGLAEDELDEYLSTLREFPGLELEGVMTHLYDADDSDNTATDLQASLFDKQCTKILEAGFRPKYFHVGQTAGSIKEKSQFSNACRVGIGIYGINPLEKDDRYYKELSALKPVLRLKSTIIKIIHLKKGDVVSYNGTFTAAKAMTVAVLPIGYYEAVPRELSNKGVLISLKGDQLPIRGRVCMNHTIVDISDTTLKVGDEVVVISEKEDDPNSINSWRREFGIFNYLVSTNISGSVRRRMVS